MLGQNINFIISQQQSERIKRKMKRIIIFLMTFILAIGTSIPLNMQHITYVEAKNASIQKVYKAYNKFMEKEKYKSRMSKEEIKRSKEYEIRYGVLDIDKNGIPELLITSDIYVDAFDTVYIYTYKKGKVDYIGKMELAENEIHDYVDIHYNQKTKMLWLMSANEGEGHFISYKYNGTNINREKIYYLEYEYGMDDEYEDKTKELEKIWKNAGKRVNIYANTSESRQQNLTFQLNKSSLTLYKSDKAKLKVTGKLSGLKWSSSNPKVAAVKNGMVTAKKKGKAVIKATLNETTVKCKVTVKDFNANKFMKKYIYGKWYVDYNGERGCFVRFSKHKFFDWIYDVTRIIKKPNQNVYIYMIRRSDKVRMRYTVYKKKSYKYIHITYVYNDSYQNADTAKAKRK